jgi:hypothetical protein
MLNNKTPLRLATKFRFGFESSARSCYNTTMRKEILIAILVGLVLGLFITYGVYQAKSSLDTPEQPPVVTGTNEVPEKENEVAGKLTIISPKDETIQKEKNVLITGTTLADNYVIIFVNNAEIITNADDVGNFSVDAQLQDGSNIITVNSLDEDGNNSKRTLTVIVTQEALTEDEKFLSNENDSTTSAQTKSQEGN